MPDKPKPKKPIPFDDALKRIVNAPPKPKKSSGDGGQSKKPGKAKHRKPR